MNTLPSPVALPAENSLWDEITIGLGYGLNSNENTVEKHLKPIVWNLSERPHITICGQAGSGKTVLAHLILEHLNSNKEQYDYHIIDLTRVSYNSFKNGASSYSITELEALKTVEKLHEEMIRRHIQMGELGKSNYQEIDNGRLKTQVILAENILQHITHIAFEGETLERTNKLLTSIAAQGRSAGIHLIMINQSPQSIPKEIKVNSTLNITTSKMRELGTTALFGSSHRLSDAYDWTSRKDIAAAKDMLSGKEYIFAVPMPESY